LGSNRLQTPASAVGALVTNGVCVVTGELKFSVCFTFLLLYSFRAAIHGLAFIYVATLFNEIHAIWHGREKTNVSHGDPDHNTFLAVAGVLSECA
jgi:hypothetical protein